MKHTRRAHQLIAILIWLAASGGASAAEPAQTPSIRLGIAGKNVDENGMLVVDANLPAFDGSPTTADVFRIPYIQSSPTLEATATVQGAPAGAAVRFALSTGQSVTDSAPPFTASFTLPRMGEYRLDAFLVAADDTVLAQATIDPLGYGRILVSIGDSITAGKNGHYVGPGPEGFGPGPYLYPVGSADRSPVASADGRNFYQSDNFFVTGDRFYRGYQTTLNDTLTACSQAPVFILNDGFSGLRTAEGDNSVLAKMSAYNSHIAALGATDVLLMIGTNDSAVGTGEFSWYAQIKQVVGELQQPNPGLRTWVARVPWRADDAGTPNWDETTLVDTYNDFLQGTTPFGEQFPGIVAEASTPSNPVSLGPDFFAHFQANQGQIDTDELHPTPQGLEEMARLWGETLCPAFAPPSHFVSLPLVVRQ